MGRFRVTSAPADGPLEAWFYIMDGERHIATTGHELEAIGILRGLESGLSLADACTRLDTVPFEEWTAPVRVSLAEQIARWMFPSSPPKED